MKIISTYKYKLLFLIVLFFISCLTFSQNIKQQKTSIDSLRYKKNPSYDLQIGMFDLYKTRQADIVMLGNSLTAGASWAELLGRSNVASRAITGDILQGFNARINSVIKLKPKIVFIMGGLNDIYSWIPVEEVFKRYVDILNNLQSNGITVVIQLTTYVAKDYAKEWGSTPQLNLGRNKEIDRLNKMLSDYAATKKIEVINLLPSIATRDGYLRPELTWDGVHFKAEAYRIWIREVEKVLRKYKM